MRHLTAFNLAFVLTILAVIMMTLSILAIERVSVTVFFGAMALLMMLIMRLETEHN